VTELVGNKPLVRLRRLVAGGKADVVAKLEFYSPAHSVKDRIGVSMLDAAEKAGKIKPDTIILEPTSGNTGIGLAFACAARGYKLVLTMPDTMSKERRMILRAYGAEVILTPGSEGMPGCLKRTEDLAASDPRTSSRSSSRTARTRDPPQDDGEEIWRDTDGKADILVAGIAPGEPSPGGGGHQGAQARLQLRGGGARRLARSLRRAEGPHPIQGIGAGFIPDVLNTKIYDEVIPVKNDDALAMAAARRARRGSSSVSPPARRSGPPWKSRAAARARGSSSSSSSRTRRALPEHHFVRRPGRLAHPHPNPLPR